MSENRIFAQDKTGSCVNKRNSDLSLIDGFLWETVS